VNTLFIHIFVLFFTPVKVELLHKHGQDGVGGRDTFEGEVTDLTYFFVHLKNQNGETITIPNSILLQKPISVIEKSL
jgi:small-conductance mechanosensitive channel